MQVCFPAIPKAIGGGGRPIARINKAGNAADPKIGQIGRGSDSCCEESR